MPPVITGCRSATACNPVIAESVHDKGLDIEVDAHAVPLWLRGDPTRLRQALLNYASNAVIGELDSLPASSDTAVIALSGRHAELLEMVFGPKSHLLVRQIGQFDFERAQPTLIEQTQVCGRGCRWMTPPARGCRGPRGVRGDAAGGPLPENAPPGQCGSRHPPGPPAGSIDARV